MGPPTYLLALPRYSTGLRRGRRATGTARGATTVAARDTATLVVVGGSLAVLGVVGRGVDEDGDVHEEAVVERVAETHVVDKRVVVDGGLADADAILRVEGKALCVGRVGLQGLDLGDEVLIEEELADVRRRPAVRHVRVVRQESGAVSRHQVDVRRAARVVTGKEGVEFYDAVLVGQLDASAVSRIQAALAPSRDAGVDAGGVASPLEDLRSCVSKYCFSEVI